MKNHLEADWLTLLPHYSNVNLPVPESFVSPGDLLIFDKTVVLGIDVPDSSPNKDLSKLRSSGEAHQLDLNRFSVD